MILVGCGGFGISMAAGYRRTERLLRQLKTAARFMKWELQYRLTPLPELCRMAGREVNGALREVFQNLAKELNWQSQPEVHSCMTQALKHSPELPVTVRRRVVQLGRILGRFDLEGQLQGLDTVISACESELRRLETGREYRLRNYQTLGICAGAALVILFV